MEGNKKLMLGLIWTLIRRYQIRSSGKKVSTKQAMLQWLETLIPEKHITNFSSNWNDGTALCTLVDRLRPGLCANHSVLNPENGLENCRLGMTLASNELGVPQILKPEHLNNPKMDEMSVMTYLSYFCKPHITDLLAWVQSKIPHQNVTNFVSDWNTGVNLAALLEAISPGLFPDWNQLDPHDAIGNLEKAMTAAEELGVARVLQPADFAAPDVDEINIVTYISRIQKCKPMSLPDRCTASGQGIVKAFVGREVHFEVNASHGGLGELIVDAKSSTGKDVPVIFTETRKAVYNVSYTATEPGFVTISVKWGKNELSRSPFKVSVVDTGAFKFYGPEITEGKICKIGSTVTMTAEGIADIKDLEVSVNGTKSLKMEPKGSHEATCIYVPRKAGTEQVIVKMAGKEIPQSPFELFIVDPSSCKVVTHDADPACIGRPFSITVSADKFNIRGLAATAISSSAQSVSLTTDVQDDMKVIIRYTPKELGSHSITVKCGEDNIQGSPVSFEVIDTMKAVLKDSLPRYVHLGKPATVNFQTMKVGNAPFDASTSNANIQVTVSESGDDMKTMQINPLSLGESELTVTLGGYPLTGFPAMIKVVDASVCSAYGKALASREGKVEELFEFMVQATNAGDGELEVIPAGPTSRYSADIENLENGKYNVSFTSYEAGLHSIEILWSGQPIPDSPVAVKFVNNASGRFTVSGEGLQNCTARKTAQFVLLGPESGLLEDQVLDIFLEGNGRKCKNIPSLGPFNVDPNILISISDQDSGKYEVEYCVPESGDYDVIITCSGEQISGSPFNLYALPAPEPDKCLVFGPAIDDPSSLVVGKPIEFKVDSTAAGTGGLDVTAFDSTMTAIPVYLGEQRGKKNERIHIIKTDPKCKGKHTLEVKWSDEHIPDSPMHFDIGDPKLVRIVSIPDKESFIAKIGEPFDIMIDDSNAGPGILSVKVKSPSGIRDIPEETAKNKYKKFSIVPHEIGRIELFITYSGIKIMEFPWFADVINTQAFEVVSSVMYAKQGDYVKYVVAGMKKSNAKNMLLTAKNGDHDATVKADMKKDGSAIARFTAKRLGRYDVTIMCAKEHVSGSPFPVFVVNPDNAKIKKDLPSTLILGRSYVVEIDGSKCGPGELQYSLTQQESYIKCTLDSVTNGLYKITVHALSVGKSEIGFQWEEFPIGELKKITIVDLGKCRCECPKLIDKKTAKQNEKITVNIDVSECGECVPTVLAKGPQASYAIDMLSDSKGKYFATFTPWQTGDHCIQVTIDGNRVPNTPLQFLVVKNIIADQIIASGDSLKEALTEQKNIVTIHGLEGGLLERGQLTYNLDNMIGDFSTPSECTCVDTGSGGIYTLTYTTYDDGDHCLEIMYEGNHINSSPFKIFIKPQPRADQCIASGHIIQPNAFLNVKEHAEIVVDSTKAGGGVLKASGKQPDGSMIRLFVSYEDNLHYLNFDASKIGKHVITVEWDEEQIPGSPFEVNVIDPNRCLVTGDIPTNIQIDAVKFLTIDTTGAGPGVLNVSLDGTYHSSFVKCTVTEEWMSQYKVQFEGCVVGGADVSIQWGGYDVQKSPFRIEVCDASRCVLEAENVRNNSVQAGYPFEFIVKSMSAGKSKPVIRPSPGSDAQYIVDVPSHDDTDEHTVFCTPQTIGNQEIDIFWVEDEIRGSPLSFSVFDPYKCHVIGLPDSSTFTPVIGEDIAFSVDQSEAGSGTVKVIAKFSDGTEEDLPFTKKENVSNFICSPHIPGRFELVLEMNGAKILKTPWISDVPDPKQFKVTRPKGTGKVYEPLKFFITGVNEQKQNFTVTAVHPDHPATVTVESGKERNTAVATFTPEAVGKYNVNVKHASQDIDGSPFVIDVVNPGAIDIINPPPAQVAINEQGIITLKTTNAGSGPLTCPMTNLTGDVASTSTESTIIDSTDGKEVHFTADKVGTTQITLRWGDHIVPPSPYTVHFIDSTKVTISWPDFESGEPINLGEPSEVIINCCEAGKGVPDVKVHNRTSDINSTAIKIADKKDGTFVASITPWKAGVQELIVTFGGHRVSDNPIEFLVRKNMDSRGITAHGEGLALAIVGEPTIVTINSSITGLVDDGLLKASCICVEEESADTKQDIAIELTDMKDGTYNLTILYSKIGNFVLHIDYQEEPIYQSPFNVSVKTAPNAESCRVFGTTIEKMKKGQAFLVSQSIQFMIDTSLAGNGYLMCTVQDAVGDPVRVFSNDEETDGKRISYLQFDPYDVGNYTVQVFWSSEQIPGTPLVFSVVDPTRCLVQGLPIRNHGAVLIGEEFKFVIVPGNCGIKRPDVYVTSLEDGDNQQDVEPDEVTETNVYKYKLQSEEQGTFNINVTIGGCHIPGSPFKCEALDPDLFAIFGLNLKSDYAVVCELVSFKIQGKPPQGETYAVTAHGPQADLSCDLKSISETSTEASFVPIEPGSYEVFVECANKHVPGSPFTINVADPSKCQIMEIPSHLQINVKHEMIIKTRGAGAGELNAKAMDTTGNDTNLVTLSIEDKGLDTYCVSIQPHRVGNFQLHLTWAGFVIPQAPLRISICDASQCKVYGQAIKSKKGKVGEAVSFTIVSNKAGTSKPAVSANGPSAQYTITPKEVGENKHEAQFTPWEVGQHTVEISWGGGKIPNSPFTIDVKKNLGGLPTCHATGEGLKKAITGQQAMFTLVSSEVGLLEAEALKVSVAGVRGNAEVELTDLNDGCYQVKYLPPNPGAYVAKVTYNERQIPGSPFKISCVPGPNANKCRVEGLHHNTLFLTGNPIEFSVNSSEAGYGQLRVFIQGPKEYHPKVYVADNGKGVHSVKFDAMLPGRYFIVVAWSEKHVPGSPFKIKIHPAPDASKVIATGPGLLDGPLDGNTTFSIDTKDAGIGTLLIRVHGIKDSFKIEAHPEKADDPRILIANYFPKVPGSYAIFVRWSGVHVPGSPFNIRLFDDDDDGTEQELDGRKMIRGVRGESMEVSRRRSRKPSDYEVSGRPRRRTSSRERILIVDGQRGKPRRTSRKEQVVVTTRRVSQQQAATMSRESPEVIFKSSKTSGMVRTRSGSELPPVDSFKPKKQLRKNPSMGQMPMYIPQSE